jgi:cob(I)alamin adenosyltransferase
VVIGGIREIGEVIMLKQGLIQIYTGDGKGKTTAAVGQAVRAIGQGLKVCYISFFKNPRMWGYGEIGILKKLGADVYHFAGDWRKGDCPFFRGLSPFLRKQIRAECLKALGLITEIFKKNYDLIVLDEINIALKGGFLKENELLFFLRKKPKSLEVVLTGRGAVQQLIRKASLVTEMKKIKHPFDKGIKARKGIEY